MTMASSPAVFLGHPGADVPRARAMRLGLAPHVMGQRAAAARPACHDNLHPMPGEQANGGIVDVGVKRLLRTAGHQRNAHPPLALGRKNLRIIVARNRRNDSRGHFEHRPQARVRQEPPEGPPDLRPQQRQTEPPRIGQDPRQQPTQRALAKGPFVAPFDIGAGVVHQMHVMHARRAGRHAGQTGQAAVNVLDRPRVGHPFVLQHVLDQVDAPARAVELVAEHLIGRAGRGAEPAMHAGAQDVIGARGAGIGQLRRGKFGFHGLTPPCPARPSGRC